MKAKPGQMLCAPARDVERFVVERDKQSAKYFR
jgi:hypothetical protein